GEVELVMVRIALRVRFLLVGGPATAKRHVARFRAIRQHRDLAQTSLLRAAAVVLLQQLAHALLRRRVVLLQNQVGDGADDAMPRKVPCRSRGRDCARRPGGEACHSNPASHVRAPSLVVSSPRVRSWSVSAQKNRLTGRGRPRFSRSVLPSYSRRNRPRRCNSGTTRSTKSSSPPGRYGNCIVKPSEPSVISHSSISSAIVTGVPTIASPEWPPRRCASCRTVRFSRFARSIARCRPLFEALLSGMSGSGPSGSNFDASWPSAIDSEPMAFE